MIRTICLNPALDKTALIAGFHVNQVNRIVSSRKDAGGKAVAKLGGNTCAYALLGGNVGTYIQDAVINLGISCISVPIEEETRTDLKLIDTQTGTHTDINERGPLVSSQELNLLQRPINDIRQGAIVVLSGSLPRGISSDTYASWIRASKKAGASVFLDTNGRALVAGIDASPTLIKPNLHELSELVGQEITSQEGAIQAAQDLLRSGIKEVVISRGADGAIFVTQDKVLVARAPRVPVGSTAGAGDALLGAIAYAWEHFYSFEDTAVLAIASGSANVMQSGSQSAERSVIESLLPKVKLERP